MSNPLALVRDASYVPTAAQAEINKVIPTSLIPVKIWSSCQDRVSEYGGAGFLELMQKNNVKMRPTASVYIPQTLVINGVERFLSLDVGIMNKSQKKFDKTIGVLYSTPGNAVELRSRSGDGVKAAIEIYSNLDPSHTVDTLDCNYGMTREACAAKSLDTYYVSAAPPAASMGRILSSFVKSGERMGLHFRPPDVSEANDALIRCGLNLTAASYHSRYIFTPKGLDPADYSEFMVKTNATADCGLPILQKLRNKNGINTEAQELLGALNQYCLTALEQAYESDPVDGIDLQMKKWAREQPYLVAAVGKTKPDYYNSKKISEAKLRFYNVVNKSIGMIMSMATQEFEAHARSVFEGSFSAQGISLSKGGCDKLMAGMNKQLADCGFAYVHCGDDSYVIYDVHGRFVLLSLDMTAFDLTQRGDVMREIDNAIARELMKISPIGAQVWHSYMREHLVVVNKAHTYVVEDGGPSGVQLQSKRGDMIMDCVLFRLKTRYLSCKDKRVSFGSREAVEKVVAEVCMTLGFKECRVEDFYIGNSGEELTEILSRNAFKFLGYFIHYLDGHYVPMADVARQMSQMQYPSIKWVLDRGELDAMEAARIGAIAFNFGVPTRGCAKAVNALTQLAVDLLTTQLAKYGDRMDARLGFVTQITVFGAATPASLGGLLRVLMQDRMLFWSNSSLLRLPKSLDDIDSDDELESEMFYLTLGDAKRVLLTVRQSSIPLYSKTSAGKAFPLTKGTQIRESLRAQAQVQGLNVDASSFIPFSAKSSARGRRKADPRVLQADERTQQMFYDEQFREDDYYN